MCGLIVGREGNITSRNLTVKLLLLVAGALLVAPFEANN